MKFQCVCGEIAYTSLSNFKSGSRCKKCRYSKASRSLSLDYEYVKQFFADQGCKLLEETYKNARTKMRYLCACGSESSIVFDSFKKGNRCKNCGNKKIIQKLTLKHEDVAAYFRERGCELLGTYEKAIKPVEYRCSCGRISEMSFNNFQKRPQCHHEKNKSKIIKNYKKSTTRRSVNEEKRELIYNYFLSKNCTLVDEYEGCYKPLEFVCFCGRMGRKTIGNFRKNPYCHYCGKDLSKGPNHYEWRNDRTEFALEKKLKQTCRQALSKTLKRLEMRKNRRTHELLGYTHLELKKHIESHSEWESLKDSNWHLDHIFPIVAFIRNGIKDIKLINCLDNLRPLSAIENLRKNCKYNVDEFRGWLLKKGYKINVE